MTPGTWAQLTTTGIGQAVGQGTTTGNRLPFAVSGVWDKTHQIFNFIGDDHLPSVSWHMQYRAATNDWIAPDTGLGYGSHGYDNISLNPFTSELYLNQYGPAESGGNKFHSKPWGGKWGTKTAWPVTQGVGLLRGVAWWSGAFQGAGAQGALLIYNDGAAGGQIRAYDPVANAWIADIVGFGSLSTHSGIMEYSKVHNVALLGSGNANAPKLWMLKSDRTVTPVPDAPFGVGSTAGQGNLVADPLTGDFLAFGGTKGFYSLNPLGTGGWKKLADAPAFVLSPASGPGISLISAPLEDHKAVMYVYAAGYSCFVAIYKHERK